MTNRLANRVALITGAGSGIGQGCALRLAVEGARVIVADLHKEGGEETFAKIVNAGGQGAFHRTDISRESQWQSLLQKTFEQFGRLDILVNNAGIYPRATLEQTTEAFVMITGCVLNRGCRLIGAVHWDGGGIAYPSLAATTAALGRVTRMRIGFPLLNGRKLPKFI